MSAAQQHDSTSGGAAPAAAADPPLIISASFGNEETRRGLQIKDWLKTGTGLFSSTITILAATLSVIFLLVPSLKPDAGPAEFGATLADAKIETDVALSDYYSRIRTDPPSTLSGDGLTSRGVIVSFTVVIEGYQGKACVLTWSMFDAVTNKRAGEDWLVAQPGWPAEQFTPVGMRDQANGEIYVPSPPAPGSYFVRMELTDPTGTRIATLDSPTFVVEATEDAGATLSMPTPGAP